MRWLGRAEIEECARGKLLIFQGDSLTRQLFNRLIWWVRGIPSVVEHYYQEDAYYSFSEQAGDAFKLRRHSFARGRLDAAAVAANAEIKAKWKRVDAAVAGNATLDPEQVHVLYQAFRNSKYPIDDDIAGGRFMSARVRRGQVQWDNWERSDRCDHEHPEGCTVREREGGGATAVPWDATRLLGLVQGQMGQLVLHRARPDGEGWDRAAFNVRVVAESSPTSPLYLPYISPVSPLYLPAQVRVVAESSPLLLERNSVCFTTTRKGENRTSIDLEKVLEGHKITHSDHGLSRLPPMCLHEDGHFQCSFNRIDGRRVDFFKRPLSGDCRDLTNLNTVQLILSALCGVRDGVRSVRGSKVRDGVVRCARVRDGVVRCAE